MYIHFTLYDERGREDWEEEEGEKEGAREGTEREGGVRARGREKEIPECRTASLLSTGIWAPRR